MTDGKRRPKGSGKGRGDAPTRTLGRHERAVAASLRDLDRAGLLASHSGHLRTAMRAAGRALDVAEAEGNAYGTRQAVRSLLELHEQLVTRQDEDDVAAWLRDIPDHVPDELA